MTQWDEELGLPGNREIVEHALRRSTTQVLHLAAEAGPRNRTLAERGADLLRGYECVPALPEHDAAHPVPVPAHAAGGADPVLPDTAESLLHNGTGLDALLADGLIRDRAR